MPSKGELRVKTEKGKSLKREGRGGGTDRKTMVESK